MIHLGIPPRECGVRPLVWWRVAGWRHARRRSSHPRVSGGVPPSSAQGRQSPPTDSIHPAWGRVAAVCVCPWPTLSPHRHALRQPLLLRAPTVHTPRMPLCRHTQHTLNVLRTPDTCRRRAAPAGAIHGTSRTRTNHPRQTDAVSSPRSHVPFAGTPHLAAGPPVQHAPRLAPVHPVRLSHRLYPCRVPRWQCARAVYRPPCVRPGRPRGPSLP